MPNISRHPWRTIAVVVAGIATLELLALVLTATALVAKPMAKHARAAAAKRAATPQQQPTAPTRALLARRVVTVTVLNGNGVSGAAASTASRVRARGYKIRKVGNAPRSGYGRSVVIYRAGFRPEGLRLAHDLGVRLVSPLDGLRTSNLAGARLAVVVGG